MRCGCRHWSTGILQKAGLNEAICMKPVQDGIDQHFKQHVAELGDDVSIVANQDIYSKTGIKLLMKGANINSSTYQRILEHKLLPPLEQTLSIENPVTSESLAEYAGTLNAPIFEKMQQLLPKEQSPLSVMHAIHLDPAFSFKLTVARERMHDLYAHSVSTALLCAYIGIRMGLDHGAVIDLATAGLFHDLGELHIDPALLDPSRKLKGSEIKHIHTHPLTIYMIMQELDGYSPQIAQAILEHHERLDGSGYPRGISEISRLGRLLAVAEVAVSLYRSLGAKDTARIETVLKLNMHHQMDADTISHVLLLLHGTEKAENRIDIGLLRSMFTEMSKHFSHWDAIIVPNLNIESRRSKNEIVSFLMGQVEMVRQMLESVGFNSEHIDPFLKSLSDDSLEARELQNVANEFAWQIKNIAHEMHRRCAMFEQRDDPVAELMKDWLVHVELTLKHWQ